MITVFSATNYCNRWSNAGAILLIGKGLEVTPKLIYPTASLEELQAIQVSWYEEHGRYE